MYMKLGRHRNYKSSTFKRSFVLPVSDKPGTYLRQYAGTDKRMLLPA